MIEIGIVDLSAENRRKLCALVERWAWTQSEHTSAVFPKLSLRSLAPEEVRFHGEMDLCIVGPELVSCDAAFISVLRKSIPDKVLICVVDATTYSFGLIEQLGRLLVDDVLVDTATSDEFFRRLLLLSRKLTEKKSGALLVVDAIRGGVGATFVTAGIAETYLIKNNRVCLVDTDVASQDATRFLGVRPCVNEPLKLLLDCQRVVTTETVRECVYKVWDDEVEFFCMPPPTSTDESFFADSQALRVFVSVLETLRGMFDIVVVDASPLTSAARRALTQVASRNFLVIDRDPAGAYASRYAWSMAAGCSQADAHLTVVVNDSLRGKLPMKAIQNDILAGCERKFSIVSLPHAARAGRWACSGATPAQFLHSHFQRIVMSVDHDERQGIQQTIREKLYVFLFECNRYVGQKILGLFSTARTLRTSIHDDVSDGNSSARLASSVVHPEPTAKELVSRPILIGKASV